MYRLNYATAIRANYATATESTTPTAIRVSSLMACTLEVPTLGSCDKCWVISPTSKLTERSRRICASKLKFGKHFTKTRLERCDFGIVQDTLKGFLTERTKGATGGLSQVLQCQADAARNLECLNLAGVANEAEVRFAIVDPIVRMVYEKWNLKVSIFHVVAMYST